MTELTSLTPAEIDALWAPIVGRESHAYAQRFLLKDELRNAEIAATRYFQGLSAWSRRSAESTLDQHPKRIAALGEAIDKARTEQEPFKAEWNRRGGWTRAYLVVTNGQGHVHRTRSCSTCYATTQFAWLTELSGKDEQEIVDLAGERACTVCYASAPVALRLDRPTQLFSEDEKAKKAARDERAAKKAAADAEKITVAGYHDLGHTTTKVFKTTRAATNAIANDLSSLTWYGETHPYAAGWKANIEAIRAALAAKGVAYDYERALSAARKKVTREGREPKY